MHYPRSIAESRPGHVPTTLASIDVITPTNPDESAESSAERKVTQDAMAARAAYVCPNPPLKDEGVKLLSKSCIVIKYVAFEKLEEDILNRFPDAITCTS